MGDADTTTAGRHESLWIATTPRTDFDRLEGDLRVDVAVVGGGIVGITAATHLKEAGHSVAVLEADRVVEGVTGHTTAKLTAQHGLKYDSLLSRFGAERARHYARANEAAIEEVAGRVESMGIDCDFGRLPAYTYVEEPGRRRELRREAAAAERLGLPASFVEETDLPFAVEAAVRFDDQAHFHPRKYLLALAEDLPGDDCHVFEETRALDVDGGRTATVETDRGTVRADDVVLATHFPLVDPALYFARLSPKRSYVVAARLEEEPPAGMYYRPTQPYYSVRPHPSAEGPIVLVGGESHRTGEGGDVAARYERVERAARRDFDVAEVEYRWSTQDFASVDGVPLVGEAGPTTDGVYVATGFGGWGMTNGTAAGMLLADLVRGEDNPWAPVYDPNRFTPAASAREFASHNAASAGHFVGDWLSPRPTETAELSPGEGDVYRRGVRPVAAYRDEDGELHLRSAVCTHLRCVVRWNDGEGTWDCPCHGSRFDADGTVLEGPANRDLPRLD